MIYSTESFEALSPESENGGDKSSIRFVVIFSAPGWIEGRGFATSPCPPSLMSFLGHWIQLDRPSERPSADAANSPRDAREIGFLSRWKRGLAGHLWPPRLHLDNSTWKHTVGRGPFVRFMDPWVFYSRWPWINLSLPTRGRVLATGLWPACKTFERIMIGQVRDPRDPSGRFRPSSIVEMINGCDWISCCVFVLPIWAGVVTRLRKRKKGNDIFLEFNVENIFLFYRAIKRYFLKYDFFVIKWTICIYIYISFWILNFNCLKINTLYNRLITFECRACVVLTSQWHLRRETITVWRSFPVE